LDPKACLNPKSRPAVKSDSAAPRILTDYAISAHLTKLQTMGLSAELLEKARAEMLEQQRLSMEPIIKASTKEQLFKAQRALARTQAELDNARAHLTSAISSVEMLQTQVATAQTEFERLTQISIDEGLRGAEPALEVLSRLLDALPHAELTYATTANNGASESLRQALTNARAYFEAVTAAKMAAKTPVLGPLSAEPAIDSAVFCMTCTVPYGETARFCMNCAAPRPGTEATDGHPPAKRLKPDVIDIASDDVMQDGQNLQAAGEQVQSDWRELDHARSLANAAEPSAPAAPAAFAPDTASASGSARQLAPASQAQGYVPY
jgi:hypothetical protein